MRHLKTILLCLLLCFALASSAFAMDYVPDSFQAENINGIQRIVKIYTLPPDVNPGNLWEPSFAYDGYYYTWAYTTKEENAYELTKEVTEMQTVETEKKDLEAILELLPNRIEYDDGVFEGELVYGSMSNSTSVAGIIHLREDMVSLGDGMSELVLVRDPGRVDAYGDLAAAVISRRFDNENLIILHTRRATFHFAQPVAWTRDGEDGGKHRDVTLCNYHAPVQLIF